ncbi:hypothetical protein ACFOET_03060 [Parapedobacter deserti]|uniref:DUF4397 domain-containing protein n=1 Tax=Parapedobacter deserti TaxID=1912957 RepID=A0ABV7JF01_9SPHI
MKRQIYTGAVRSLLLATVLMAGCIKDPENEPEAEAWLTVANAFFDAEAVFYRLDVGRGGKPLNSLRFRETGRYHVPSCADCKLEVFSSNQSSRVVDTTFSIQANAYYTSFLFGTEESPKHFIVEDRLPAGVDDPTAIAGLRFFNLANTAHRVTLHVAGTETIADFRNRPTETAETAGAAEVFIPTTHTGTHVLTIVDENGVQLARRTGVALDPGDYLTIFLTGDGGDTFPYHIGVLR